MARNIVVAMFFRNELHEQALVARMGPRRFVEVKAGGGILEYAGGDPRRPYCTAIAAVSQEFQLET
jgi:hypothetical protein